MWRRRRGRPYLVHLFPTPVVEPFSPFLFFSFFLKDICFSPHLKLNWHIPQLIYIHWHSDSYITLWCITKLCVYSSNFSTQSSTKRSPKTITITIIAEFSLGPDCIFNHELGERVTFRYVLLHCALFPSLNIGYWSFAYNVKCGCCLFFESGCWPGVCSSFVTCLWLNIVCSRYSLPNGTRVQ